MFVSKDLKLPCDSFSKAVYKGHIQFMRSHIEGFILGRFTDAEEQPQIKRDTQSQGDQGSTAGIYF